MPKRAASASSSSTEKSKKKKADQLVIVINLKRRADRLRKLRGVLRGRLKTWEVIEAIDGNFLTWDDAAAHLTPKAVSNGQWAQTKNVPTICQRTGSFSPHLTLNGVGCALSHRKAWARLAESTYEWALILEDDVTCVAVELESALERCVASLPSSWQLCMVGYHESTGHLLTPEMRMRLSELGPDETQTGLFGYLLRRTAAADLLKDRQIWSVKDELRPQAACSSRPARAGWCQLPLGLCCLLTDPPPLPLCRLLRRPLARPLSHQIDVQLGRKHWGCGTHFAISPDSVLVHSPKSEEDQDTDVQTLGDAAKRAHSSMQKGMLLL